MSHSTQSRNRRTRNKVLALLSAGLVLGVGATYTLASWNDSEFVFGGIDGTTPGIGTSTFEVEQNRNATVWDQHETADGGALTFSTGALALTPGDATYAGVQLRTTATSVAGTLALEAAVQSTTPALASDPDLWAALELRVVVAEAASTCAAANFTAGATYVVGSFAAPAALATAGTGTSSLSAAGANNQGYCFEISLPADEAGNDALMGKVVAPVWEFIGTSI